MRPVVVLELILMSVGAVTGTVIGFTSVSPYSGAGLEKRGKSWWPTSKHPHQFQFPKSLTCGYKGYYYSVDFKTVTEMIKGARHPATVPANCSPCYERKLYLYIKTCPHRLTNVAGAGRFGTFHWDQAQLRLTFRVIDGVNGIGQEIDFYNLEIGTVVNKGLTWADCMRSPEDIVLRTKEKGDFISSFQVPKKVLKG